MIELFRDGDLRVVWIGGGLYVGDGVTGLLIDAPEGSAAALESLDAVGSLDAVLLSSGRPRAIGGLLGVLDAIGYGRPSDRALVVWSPLGEDRPGMIVDVWERGAPPNFPLVVDGEAPGALIRVGAFAIHTASVRRGEPRWVPPDVVPVPAVGFRVSGPVEIAYVGGPATPALCKGAKVAVVEVGVRPWPSHPEPWRLSVDQAVRLAAGAQLVVLVGDDGRIVGGDAS